MTTITSNILLPNYNPEEVGLKGEKGDNGQSSFIHIAYSNSSDGGVDFSTTDASNRSFMGSYSDFEMIDSSDPSRYEWQRVKGDSGKDGIAGKDGVGLSSTAITYAASTSASVAPSSGWTAQVPTVAEGSYLWTKTVWNYTDSTSETGYSVARMGTDGDRGQDGIAGKDGVGIKTTVIEYAVNTSGTVRPTTGWSTTIPVTPQGQYLWTRTTWTYTDNTTEQGYSVARQGVKGDSSHFHTAYSWSADGTDRFTKVYPGENFIRNSTFENGMTGWTGTSYWNIDTATKLNEHSSVKGAFASASDSAKALRQTLTLGDLAVGDDIVWSVWAKSDTPNSKIHLEIWGSAYRTDVTIGTEWTHVSLSGKLGAVFAVFVWNITPGTFWVSETKLERGDTPTIYTPAPSEDYANAYPKYIGTYSDFNAEGSDSPKDYTWARSMGNAGATGKDGVAGKDGVGLKTTVINYAASTSGTTAPSTGWQVQVPTVAPNNYLWTRTVWTYTDNTSETGYSVAKMGADGTKGNDGIAGKDGVGIKTTLVEYVVSVTGTNAPASGWSTTIPNTPEGQFLWTRTKWTYTDNTTEVGYSVAKQGAKGSTGATGATGPNGVGIASTIIEYNKSTSSTTKPTTGWTSAIPSISGGEYLWTRTTLNYTNSTKAESYTVSRQGQDGSDGQLFTGEFAPTNFNEGDLWYKVVSGKVTAVFKATSGQWIEVPFDSSVIAETIVGKTIQASRLTGSTIDGGKISGAEFLNEYENVTSGVNQVTDGKLGIKDGILQAGSTYYLTNSAGERRYKFATTEADIHQGTVNLRQRLYDDAGKQTSESTTSVSGGLISLSLTDASGNYHGVLDAKALTKTPWINAPLGSAFMVAEDNPPQYRITYNLDGTRRVSFRGQFKLKSGNMSVGTPYCPFQIGSGTGWSGNPSLPLNIAPPVAVFAALTIEPVSGAAIPGRMGMTPGAKMGFLPGTNSVHVNLNGFEYDID